MNSAELKQRVKLALRLLIRWLLIGAISGAALSLFLPPGLNAASALLLGALYGSMLGPFVGLAYLGLRWVYSD